MRDPAAAAQFFFFKIARTPPALFHLFANLNHLTNLHSTKVGKIAICDDMSTQQTCMRCAARDGYGPGTIVSLHIQSR